MKERKQKDSALKQNPVKAPKPAKAQKVPKAPKVPKEKKEKRPYFTPCVLMLYS